MAAAESVLYAVDRIELTGLTDSPPAAVEVTYSGGIEMTQGVVRGGIAQHTNGTELDVKLFLWADEGQTRLLRTIGFTFGATNDYQQIEAPIWVPFTDGLWISGLTTSATAITVQVLLFVEKGCLAARC